MKSKAFLYRRSLLESVCNLREEAMWLRSSTDARDMKATAEDLRLHLYNLTK